MSARRVAFVHAKGSSERVPGKNRRVLGDRPLFCHAIAIARAASRVDEVVIDSDCAEILALGAEWGATPLQRPLALASNSATGDDLAHWQASSRPQADFVVQVIPTAPFLSPASVDAALAMLEDDPRVNSVAGVTSDTLYLWQDGRPAYFRPDGSIPNSNTLVPTVWETTGLYANRADFVRGARKRMDVTRVRPLLLGRLEAIDVNTEEDFAFAEIVWRGLHAGDAAHVAVPPR
jgi:CMP-N-acetylneuraminic acid synthetase